MLKAVFGNETLLLLLSASLVLSAADTVTAVVAALRSGTFNVLYLRSWLSDHLLQGVFPIVLLAAVSAVIGALPTRFPDADPILVVALSGGATIAWGIAIAAFVTFAASTWKSLEENVSQAKARNKPGPPAQ